VAKKSFRCKLVTPSAALLDETVGYASVPAWDGLIGFLPGRAAFLGRLGLGELRLEPAEGQKGKSFLIDGGFIRMADDVMTILAEHAVSLDSVSAADVEADMKAAAAIKDPVAQAQAVKRSKMLSKFAKR